MDVVFVVQTKTFIERVRHSRSSEWLFVSCDLLISKEDLLYNE